MRTLPVLKPQKVETVIKRLGFEKVRQRGSHCQYRHIDGRFTTIPFHKGRDLSPILLKQILKDINVTPEKFLKLL